MRGCACDGTSKVSYRVAAMKFLMTNRPGKVGLNNCWEISLNVLGLVAAKTYVGFVEAVRYQSSGCRTDIDQWSLLLLV